MHAQIEAILNEQGAIKRADHPRLRSALHRAKLAGALTTPLPGTYVAAGSSSAETWLHAVAAWSAPLGVFHAGTAAALWLPVEAPRALQLAHPTLRGRGGIAISRQTVPAEFVVRRNGMRIASPAFAAAELAAVDDGRAICDALRLRLADASSLRAATLALAGTPGQRTRQQVVASAAGNPWSYAELRLHRLLRDAGITDWVANRRLILGGRTHLPDLRMRSRKLILEFDGREHHDTRATFIPDRERLNAFAAAGYVVLRFGWEHLDDPGYVVSLTRQSLRMAPPYS